jgi:hypothetical protein
MRLRLTFVFVQLPNGNGTYCGSTSEEDIDHNNLSENGPDNPVHYAALPLDDKDDVESDGDCNSEENEPIEPASGNEPKPQETARLSTQQVEQITSAMRR